MRIITAIMVITLFAFPASAQSETFEGSSNWDACLPLLVSPNTIYQSLSKYETVFGKPAIEWRKKDYDQLISLATACDGVGDGVGTTISAHDWVEMVGKALKNVYTKAAMHQQIMDWAKAMKVDDIHLPDCGTLVQYTPPGKNLQDNSENIFGVPLYGMTPNDLMMAIKHMNNCMAFLPNNGLSPFGVSTAQVNTSVNAMIDRALLIQIRNREWNSSAWSGRSPTDFILEFHGYEVPPTLLTDEGKALVRRYNNANRSNGMTLDATYNLMAFTSALLENDPPDIDRAYAEAIKEKLNDGIFRTMQPAEQQSQ